jgi:hypothetical protein
MSIKRKLSPAKFAILHSTAENLPTALPIFSLSPLKKMFSFPPNMDSDDSVAYMGEDEYRLI